jgi:ribonuclease HII
MTADPLRITLGIDEAGRGPALGPMVVAAVALDASSARRLRRDGLRDSKSYGSSEAGRARRSELAATIRRLAHFVGFEIADARTVDARVAQGQLNHLERELAERLITSGPPCHRIVADGRTLFSSLALRFSQLEAHDRAEDRHASVAAASVIAKTVRDEWFAQFCARHRPQFGELAGGGYVNAATRRFLTSYVTQYRQLPPEARRTWPHAYLEHLLAPT